MSNTLISITHMFYIGIDKTHATNASIFYFIYLFIYLDKTLLNQWLSPTMAYIVKHQLQIIYRRYLDTKITHGRTKIITLTFCYRHALLHLFQVTKLAMAALIMIVSICTLFLASFLSSVMVVSCPSECYSPFNHSELS